MLHLNIIINGVFVNIQDNCSDNCSDRVRGHIGLN